MAREIQDPDVGSIEAPDTFITQNEWEAQRGEVEAAMAEGRTWPEGSTSKCPNCKEEAFEARSDLTHQIVQGRHVVSFRHLHGARCSSCGAQALEPYELIGIEDEAGIGVTADYEAKVSRIGSGTLGTYWPKDVERVLGLRPHKRAFIEVVDRDTVLVRFAPPDPG